MAKMISQIRPASGAVGPYFTITDADGVTIDITSGLTLAAAYNRVRDVQAAAAGALTVTRVIITTDAS